MTEQADFDRRRRAYTTQILRGARTTIDDGADPAALIGALMLTAGVIALEYDLGSVLDFISEDLDRDADAITRGDWHPSEAQ